MRGDRVGLPLPVTLLDRHTQSHALQLQAGDREVLEIFEGQRVTM